MKKAFVLLAVFLTGCRVGPNYTRPSVNTPPAFRGAAAANQRASFADLPWWEVFQDETLKDLIKTSLANNYDLGVAIARVQQARAAAREAWSEYLPTLNYALALTYGHNQFTGSPASNLPGAQGFFLGIARASWEADLWGRIRRLNEGARAQYTESEDLRRGVMLTLVSDVSQAYFELLGLQLQLEITKGAAQSYSATYKLFTDRLNEGLGNALQTSRAQAALAIADAGVPELERQIALKENQINVLLGRNPGAIATKVNLLADAIPLNVPAGLPSSLLERRPDLLAAAQRVRFANAQIGIAKADYFPRIGLTTFFGKLSTPLSELASGNTNAWSLGSNVIGPIFTGGAIKARKRQAVAFWEQTRLQYLQAALNAFRDVSDALITREKLEGVRAEQMRSVQSAQEAVGLSRTRYIEGLSSYVEVLEAQQALYPAQLALASTEIGRRMAVVQLYKALGGGWNLSDAQWMNASPTRP
jgi:multidrug efflux system outer membrane protein